MKSYTDLEQSKKLAEILPFESADMHLTNSSIKGEMYVDDFKPVLVPYLRSKDSLDAYSKIVNNMIAWEVIPCWSIAALYSVLPAFTLDSSDDKYFRIHCCKNFSAWHDNPVDVCYELILKLNEQNIL